MTMLFCIAESEIKVIHTYYIINTCCYRLFVTCIEFGTKDFLYRCVLHERARSLDSIEQVGEFKYLVVWLDSSLKFTSHISKMSSKISSAIGVVSMVSRYLPVVQRKMLYNAMVLPYFNYCSITWSTADQKHLDVLERLQKRAERMVLGVPSRTSTR